MSPPLIKAPLSLAAALGWLGLSAGAAVAVSLSVAWFSPAPQVFPAALIAVSGCWLPAGAALVVAWFAQQNQQPVGGVLGGVLVHLFAPLALLVGLTAAAPALAAAGFKFFVLGNFLASLAVEATLATRLVDSSLVPSAVRVSGEQGSIGGVHRHG